MKVEPIAEKIAKDIFEYNTKSENIEWNSDTQVRVLISKVIPETNKQTTAARRKRFRKKIEELLFSNRWKTTSRFNIYEKC